MKNNIYIKKINKVIDFIEDNIDSKLTLKKISKIADFSEYHFHRIFKSIMGETLNNYIKRIKMEKISRRIILDKKRNITDIAFDSGYNSSANLSRDYNIFYNISPSKNRNQKLKYDFRNHNPEIKVKLKFLGIKNILDKQIIYTRIATGYNPEIIKSAFGKLFDYSINNPYLFSVEQFIGIAYDDPDYTPLNKCRYDVCFSIKEKIKSYDNLPYNIKNFKGGKYAVFLFEGKSEDYFSAWDIIFKEWVIKSQYLPDNRPHLEIYILQDQLEDNIFKSNLCLPVKKN